jgi:hypothetical protein
MVVENLTDRMYAGNKRIFEYTVTDVDASPPTSPLDLTPFTLRWAMSVTDAEGNYSTTPSLEKVPVATDAPNGVCQVTVLSTDTVSLAAGLYYFELEVVDGSSEPVTVATGVITLLANVVNT